MKVLTSLLFVLMVLGPTSDLLARTPNQNQKFVTIANRYIEQFLQTYPVSATGLGDHRFDNRLSDNSGTGLEQQRKLHRATLEELKTINPNQLSPNHRTDYRILRTNLESALFELEVVREHEWNPMFYNPTDAVYLLVARDFAPLKDRLRNVEGRLKAIPAYLEAAKANLKNPPKIHTETAISQNKGSIGFIRDDLQTFIDQVPDMKKELAPAQAQAIAALENYGQWLEKELLPRSTGDFRLGEEKYRQRLRYALDADLSKEEILQRAEAELKAKQEEMYQTAWPLFQKFFPGARPNGQKGVIKAVLDKLAENHPTNDTIIAVAQKDTKICQDFVKAKNLLTVPKDPVKIIIIPEFRRSLGGLEAYCDSTGPLEKKGDIFYAVSPTSKDTPPEEAESLFREYNNYMFQVLTIHEAMPGHYVQLAQANKFKAPTLVRGIFGSGTFSEGWAVYTEGLMTEKGFGGPEVKLQQLKFLIRTITNSIIDQKIHTAGMTEKEAIDLMVNEAFQEPGEATGKWRRACLTSTQLSTYYVGYLGVKDIRRAYEAKHGTRKMKAMHDRMLSFGSIAPKYVKELMGL